MAANTITRGRLRRLAELRPERGLVLSVFFNLDPSEFATPAARATEVNSVVTAAAHKVDEADGARPRRAPGAAGRRRARARGARRAPTSRQNGTHGLAVFACGPGRPARGRAPAAPDRVARDRRRPPVRRAARAQRLERGAGACCSSTAGPRGSSSGTADGAGGGRPDRGRHAPPARPGRLVAGELPALGRAGEAQPPRRTRSTRCSRASSGSPFDHLVRRRARGAGRARSRSGCTRTCASGSPAGSASTSRTPPPTTVQAAAAEVVERHVAARRARGARPHGAGHRPRRPRRRRARPP